MLFMIIAIIVFLLGAILIYLANLDGEYEIRRSRTYDEKIDVVFDKLRDFRSWPFWSPWLIHEAETKLEFSDKPGEEGGFYTWDGKIVGAGKLQHETFKRPSNIQQRLEFTRPFKSTCHVSFELNQLGEQTEVSWIMNGHMPFLMRFMVPRMKQMISHDYDLGLAMLAGELNPEAEHPKLSFIGTTELKGRHCLCKHFEGHLEEMQKAMQAGFPELASYASENGEITGHPLSFYHKVDIKKMYFDCDMAIPVAEGIPTGNYNIKRLGEGKYYRVDLAGSYEFLELAWYSAMAHTHMLKIKLDNKRPSFEIYETDPESVASTNEIKTSLFIPIK